MKILITGAHGFVGRNLTETLKAVRDGKDRTRGLPTELELLTYTRQSPEGTLEAYCAEADFVFHLAGVNRPETEEEFLSGNRDLRGRLPSHGHSPAGEKAIHRSIRLQRRAGGGRHGGPVRRGAAGA